MKKIGLAISLAFLFSIIISCSDKLKNDARKAYELMEKSKDAITEHNFEDADRYYQQYKEIEDHYKNTDESQAFEKAFWDYASSNKN